METFAIVLVYIIFGGLFIGLIWGICYKVKEHSTFRQGRNPFNRICRKCGAHQVQYQSNIEGCEDHTWWEEIYPIGNDENCKCHKYSEYHG